MKGRDGLALVGVGQIGWLWEANSSELRGGEAFHSLVDFELILEAELFEEPDDTLGTRSFEPEFSTPLIISL